jgi:hypothetical protein
MKYGMQHHRTRPRDNGFDRTLSDTILVMSTNTGKGDLLPFIWNIIPEFDRGERCVICFECPNMNPKLCGAFLKRILAFQCLSNMKGHLMVVMYKASFAINKDGAACEARFRLLFFVRVWQAIRQAIHMLIKMNDATRVWCVIVEVPIAGIDNGGGLSRRAACLAETASCTFGLGARRCFFLFWVHELRSRDVMRLR